MTYLMSITPTDTGRAIRKELFGSKMLLKTNAFAFLSLNTFGMSWYF